MPKYIRIAVAIAWLFLTGAPVLFGQPPAREKEIFSKMMNAMTGVKSCSFVLDIHERIKGEIKFDQFVVKLMASPYKVYVYSVTPNPGAEALLMRGANHEKAVVNPNKFPIPTLNLSPYSGILRKNHQYTLWHFGFGYIQEVLSGYEKKYGRHFFELLKVEDNATWKNREYQKLTIDNPDFGFVKYRVQQGENLVKIGEKLMVNDYMILEANPQVKNFDDVKPGQEIMVPNAFGKKIIFYMDKSTGLPMIQEVYDHKGLYGRVELSSFVLNPEFSAEDFSRYNKKYGF